MRAVVGREPDLLTVEHEARIGDAVGIAADGRTEELPHVEIAGEIVIPEHDVVAALRRVRHDQGLQRGAIGDDAGLKTVHATQHHALNGAAIRQSAERFPCNARGCVDHGQSSKGSTM